MIFQVTQGEVYTQNPPVSTTKLKNFKKISGEAFDTLPPLMPRAETLQSYVDRILKENPDLSEVKVSKRAKKLGHKISSGYVSNVRTGTAKNVSMRLLKALAAGLGRPEREVIALATGETVSDDIKFQESVFAVISKEFSHLTASDQKEVMPMIEMLHREIRHRLKS